MTFLKELEQLGEKVDLSKDKKVASELLKLHEFQKVEGRDGLEIYQASVNGRTIEVVLLDQVYIKVSWVVEKVELFETSGELVLISSKKYVGDVINYKDSLLSVIEHLYKQTL